MNKTKRNGILALLAVGAFAYWKYNVSPSNKRKIKDKLSGVKDRLTKFGNELISEAENAKRNAKNKIDNI